MHRTATLAFDPAFVEEAVFLAIRQEEKNGRSDILKEWHAERETLYAARTGESDEEAFQRFHNKWFVQLGLKSRFQTVFDFFPILKECSSLVLYVCRAFTEKEEGSELYVRKEMKTGLFALQPSRLFEEASAERFLRHEWLRLSDMLDSSFCYSPFADLGGASEVENELIRERFRALWDSYISVRLNEEKCAAPLSSEERKNVEDRFETGLPLTQTALIELAKNKAGNRHVCSPPSL